MSAAPGSKLRIGVLLTFEAQMLDVGGIDLLGMLDKEYSKYLPGPLAKLGLDVKIYYIGKDPSKPQSAATGLQGLTAQAQIKAEVSISDAAVQPGSLDMLMIPGPPPNEKQSQATLDFVKQHAMHGTTILVICTGAFVAADAGIYNGRKASAPRAFVPQMRKTYPRVEWDDQRRYVKDVGARSEIGKGEIWSSGGVTNGLEMVAAMMKEKFPLPLSEAICAMADVGDKGEFYSSSVGVDNSWWIGQILRALVFGKRGVMN